MPKDLRTLITPNTVLSYSRACYDLANLLIDLSENGYSRLIIPSRGAYPFYEGAFTAFHSLFEGWEVHQLRLKFNLWLLPYTADWGSATIGLTSAQVRKFWTKILADTIRKEKTPFNRFYESLVQMAGHRLTLNTSKLTLDKYYRKDNDNTEKFIFIDTAISGRAICEIIDSFIDLDLNDFVVIMIADNDGNSLESQYKNIIEREKAKGRLVQLNVENIFSEDTSPLLNRGISSLVFPSLIEAGYNEIPEFRNGGFSGGGIWFSDAVADLRNRNPEINGIRGAMMTLIYMGVNQIISPKESMFDLLLYGSVDEILNTIQEQQFDIFNPSSTKKLVYDRLVDQNAQTKDIVDVTESHVIRINLESHVIDTLIHQAKRF